MDATVYWSPGMSLEVLEQLVIQKAYKHYQGNKTATANSLGIAIRTLDAKLDKYEMNEIDKEAQHAQRRNDREYQLARARGINPSFSVDGAFVQNGSQASEGLRPQPIINATAQQSVPLPVGKEVQEVLPKSASGNHSRKSR